jgi:hypothetical protein
LADAGDEEDGGDVGGDVWDGLFLRLGVSMTLEVD